MKTKESFSSQSHQFLIESQETKATRKKQSQTASSKTTTKSTAHHPSHTKLFLSISNDKLLPSQDTLINYPLTHLNSNQTPSSLMKVETVFTRLSEEMFFQIKDNTQLTDCSPYESYLNDNILYSYSEKYHQQQHHHSNAGKIKGFLDRTAKSTMHKQLGFNKHHKSVSMANIHQGDISGSQSNQSLLTSQNATKLEKKGSIDHFLRSQAKFDKKKEKNLNELKQYYTEKASYDYREKPQICLHSVELSKKLNSDSNQGRVYLKLFNERNDSNKKRMMTINVDDDNKPKAKSKAKSKGKRRIEAKASSSSVTTSKENQLKTVANTQKSIETESNKRQIAINEDSSAILIEKVIHQYDIEMNDLFNAKTEDNILISYPQFALILFHMGFTTKNYSNCANSIEKENSLIQEAWRVLMRKKKKLKLNGKYEGEELIQSHLILLFFLAILSLYKGKDAETVASIPQSKDKPIQKHKPIVEGKGQQPSKAKRLSVRHVPFISEEEYYFAQRLVNQFITHFRLFIDNRKSTMEKVKKKKLNKAISNPNLTFKPKTNTKKGDALSNIYFTKNGTEHKKLSLYEAYEVFRLRKENERKSSAIRKINEELKPCTFSPNLTKPHIRSVSLELCEAKQTSSKKKLKEASTTTQLNESAELKAQCTFSPQLTEYNSKVFTSNPLKGDKQVSSGLERYAMARVDRKMREYLLSQGQHSLNYLRTSKEVLKDIEKTDYVKQFHFDNEVRRNKESFEKFNPPQGDYFKSGKELLFAFEIKIEDEVKMLLYYKGDDIQKKAEMFCKMNRLGEDSKQQIISAITAQMNTIKQ